MGNSHLSGGKFYCGGVIENEQIQVFDSQTYLQ